MKNITTILLLLTIASMAPSAMAVAPGVPDGGASSLLLGIGAVGLVAARRFFGKK